MKISKTGLELVKHFEGCQLKAYYCPAGKLTIGYGHTGASVKPGMTITQEQADVILASDMERFEKAVSDRVKVPLEQGQFDALVSFAFNVGANALQNSTLLKLLNAGKIIEAVQQFGRWNKITKNGQKVASKGLTRRRLAEAYLFATGELKTDF